MDPCNNPNAARYQRQRSFSAAVDGDGDGGGGSSSRDVTGDGGDTKKKKKILHRDIERQRRQEMAALFASLRNHLPLEYIKGKRAVSDHVNGAVNFIRDAQKRVKELSARRDELRRVMGSSHHESDPDQAGSSGSGPASVMVQPCVSGIEVAVSSAVTGPEALPLSRVLQVLYAHGLDVISSLTTRVNERLMHTIQVEVNSFGCLDLDWLQQKLMEELILSRG
ncbi:PREDICTED: transcription factor bHLH126 [Tarenaya hassleriana]|uniref:transcription factor bHLH126 n=1 Tax=Tarenaya hassleriana TaxID=28532 RepID=UPI00053C8B0A|nr:PREDICTED: transcription factor bHLH126 [Tarenaya hassleriana]